MGKTVRYGVMAMIAVVKGCGGGGDDGGSGGTGGGGGSGGAVDAAPAIDTSGPADSRPDSPPVVDTQPGDGGGDAWLRPPQVPPALNLPPGAVVKVHDHGEGAQIYTCAASGTVDAGGAAGGATYAWTLKAPDAKLFDRTGVQVGTHGAGPNWTSTVDGSVVNGAKIAQADAPDATAIPWLLLRAASTSGAGVFSDITYVQRVNTVGGKAPASGCDATTVGTETRVDYSAEYFFYTGGAGAAWLVPPPDVPSLLAPPAGAVLKIHDHAIGAQIYTCTGSGLDGGLDATGATYAWVLKAPDAILYDATFAPVGTHGAGPNWTSTVDGSVVNGSKVQQSNVTGAIPWLLLRATSTSGTGVFSDIAYVQRLNTAGGVAPATGCDATTVGAETRVAYSADYYFFTASVADGGSPG
jgi:hypothetical protein